MCVCDMADVCIIAFSVFTDMFMKFQEETLSYIFSILDTCAINIYIYYMLNREDENSDHFKSNCKDLVISE